LADATSHRTSCTGSPCATRIFAGAATSQFQSRLNDRCNARQASPRQTVRPAVLLAILVLATSARSSHAQDAKGVESAGIAVSLLIEPSRIELRGRDQQHLLVTARTSDGRLADVTHRVEFAVRDSEIAQMTGAVIRGISDGSTELRIRLDLFETSVPVTVTDSAAATPVDFANDLIPILSKLGCNSGGCHGKASGQNGFKLSVFGFDPVADFEAIVKEARGRRIFPASPERSLVLLKPTGQVPHGGGKRLDVGSADYRVILEWLKQGTPPKNDAAPALVDVRVSPVDRTMSFESDQQILVTAVYSDSTARDVTLAASYATNSDIVAEVDARGRIHTGRVPGEAAITVRYMGQVAAVQVQVPRIGLVGSEPGLPIASRIDELVALKLAKLGIGPSELTDDATFLRRIFVDTIGTLPKPAEVRAFLVDTSTDKRRRAIDAVLARDEFADFWALKWADILLVDRNKLGDRGAFEFHRWLRGQFATNRPYDEWVRELITASGDTSRNGPANFFRALRTNEDVTKSISQAFLGIRLECAQCHHHPFERWAQSDFYGLAGFFNGLERTPIQPERPNTPVDPGGPELIFHVGLRETRIPYFNVAVETKPLGGWLTQGVTTDRSESPNGEGSALAASSAGVAATRDPRVPLADWFTAPANPWFARLASNRIWKHFLGRGIVEPEDDLRSTNPPTNGQLLDYLASEFVANHYDVKSIMRQVMNSSVYQLSSAPNQSNSDDSQNFSHHHVKRLSAEVLLDAMSDVTGVPERFPGRPPGTRAIALWDNRLPSYFLEIFGRPARNSPCECGRSSEPTMAQALHLMNAPEVVQKIEDPKGRVAQLLKSGQTTDDIVQELCLAALGRMAQTKELAVARRLFAEEPADKAAQDFLWALLNSYDFLFLN
jgi:hypothetical protein